MERKAAYARTGRIAGSPPGVHSGQEHDILNGDARTVTVTFWQQVEAENDLVKLTQAYRPEFEGETFVSRGVSRHSQDGLAADELKLAGATASSGQEQIERDGIGEAVPIGQLDLDRPTGRDFDWRAQVLTGLYQQWYQVSARVGGVKQTSGEL
jgi:hypothetical protein